jgi:hypothetical protein
MGYTYYQTIILIPANVQLAFAEVVHPLKHHFAEIKHPAEFMLEGDKLTIQMDDDWALYVNWLNDVRIEANEIADWFAKDRPDQDVIASTDRFISTSGDQDPNMDHFNDYVYVLEVLEDLPNVYVFDPINGEFR